MFRKNLVLLILVLFVLALSSCGSGGGGDFKYRSPTVPTTLFDIDLDPVSLNSTQSGEVVVNYILRNPATTNLVTVIAEYSENFGPWLLASTKSQTEGLRATFQGTGHQFRWSSRDDGVGLSATTLVRLRLKTQLDGVTTDSFVVDNNFQVEIRESDNSESDTENNTTENGGTDRYRVRLNRAPKEDVFVEMNFDTTQISVDPAVLTFTSTNYNSLQEVDVSAVDDEVVEGDHSQTISISTVSEDNRFDGLNTSDEDVFIIDNDLVFTLESAGNTTVTETFSGPPLEDSFEMKLAAQPTAAVTILTFYNGSELVLFQNKSDAGDPDVEIFSGFEALVFTVSNWDQTQTIRVQAVDDAEFETAEMETISFLTTSTDSEFDGIANVPTVEVSINSNDLLVVDETGNSTNVDEDTEATDAFSVVLFQQPTAPVTVRLSFDPAQIDCDPAIITFDSEPGQGGWNTPVSVSITGLVDGIVEGTHTSNIRFSTISGDLGFQALQNTPTIVVTISEP